MNTSDTSPHSIDEYIAGFPASLQVVLQKVRMTIRAAVPEAEEKIRDQGKGKSGKSEKVDSAWPMFG
jgi:hypothetical protein